MPEHRIRLRGAWELVLPGVSGDSSRRWSLPAGWPEGLQGPVRLIRRFGPPTIDVVGETISLELREVPGLTRLDLNGKRLADPPDGVVDWVVPLVAPLPARNLLMLEVDLDQVDPTREWGAIALLIAPGGAGGLQSRSGTLFR